MCKLFNHTFFASATCIGTIDCYNLFLPLLVVSLTFQLIKMKADALTKQFKLKYADATSE